jgi:uridine kinase
VTDPSTRPFVIAIGGPSGSGKSSVVNRVASLLGDAVTLFFDDYASVSSYPSDLRAWYREGANPDEWRTPVFAADVLALRGGRAVSPPGGTARREPAEYVVIEEPFGRERQEMRTAIDLVAIIDLPLEVALVRVVRRAIEPGLVDPAASAGCLSSLNQFLNGYVDLGLYDLYRVINRRALASCDVALDGLRPVDELADQVVRAARARLAARTTLESY